MDPGGPPRVLPDRQAAEECKPFSVTAVGNRRERRQLFPIEEYHFHETSPMLGSSETSATSGPAAE
jgi:hypothetical protein